jgi:S1-C subfamily serine protease
MRLGAILLGQGEGSGVVYRSDGIVVTNAHVVGNAPQVTVQLLSGGRLQGTVRGVDRFTDLAVVAVDADGPGDTVEVTVVRCEERRTLEVEPGERPS